VSVAVALVACAKEEPTAATTTGAAEPAAAGAPAAPHPMPGAPAADVDLSGIAPAEGGKTIAEVFAGKADLAGQAVVFRGKVVKANSGIMGMNWLHVRDGSGAEGSNDLTVTTLDATPGVGDTVLVSGTVALDRDLGMGYTYDVIVENATVTVEAAPH
jgi:hypothetical protein